MEREPDRLLYPYDEALDKLGGIGRTTLWQLVNDGQLVRVNVVVAGYHRQMACSIRGSTSRRSSHQRLLTRPTTGSEVVLGGFQVRVAGSSVRGGAFDSW